MSRQNTINQDFTSLQYRYLDERFSNIRDSINININNQEKLAFFAKEAADKAIVKAEMLAAHNQMISNEFRGQLKDQAETLMNRSEALNRFDSLGQTVNNKFDNIDKDIKELRQLLQAKAPELVTASES